MTLAGIFRNFGGIHRKAKGYRFYPTGGGRSKFGANSKIGGQGTRRCICEVLGGSYGLPKMGHGNSAHAEEIVSARKLILL